MFEHRFRELITEPIVANMSFAAMAFVPCPCPLMATFTPTHQAFVADVYRIAREMTETQLRKKARPRVPAFSIN
jgi:hypothetical protein